MQQHPQVGFRLHVLQPGEPSTMYHRESDQEDFLVLSGECLLIVEAGERRLREWDLKSEPAGLLLGGLTAGERARRLTRY